MTATAQPLLSVDEFLASADEREGRWELENGVLIGVAPERLAHSDVKGAAWSALRSAIARAHIPCRAVLDGPAVRITARTAYQPDALVYCGERLPPGAREIPAPILVVEVLSPSTAARDVTRKLIGYFSLPSVIHYLILDPEACDVVHHKRGEGGLIETRIALGGSLRLDPPGLDVAVAELFATD